VFRFINLEAVTFLAYNFRDSKIFAHINLENLTLLDYFFSDSKSFDLLI